MPLTIPEKIKKIACNYAIAKKLFKIFLFGRQACNLAAILL